MRRALTLVLAVSLLLTLAGTAFAATAADIVRSLAAERAAKTQPFEDPSGGMNRFYAALSRTAAGTPGAITHVCHFGDSLIEMELVPGPMRVLLQKKFGDCGHGFVLGSRPKPWYRPYNLFFDPSAAWISFDMGDRQIPDRRFGLGGATAIAFKDKAALEVGTDRGVVGGSVNHFQILFPMEPNGGPLEVSLDGKTVGTIDTTAPAYRDAFAEIETTPGAHRLELIGRKKSMRLQGVILEDRSHPGVVYDALGINGSGVQTYLSVDAVHWENQLRHRHPNLVVIGVGTNDTYMELNFAQYKKQMRELVERARTALPDATVMLIAPLDRALKQGGTLTSHPITPKIVAAQRELAKEMGIPFWSAFDAMGGEGSMARWYNAKPRLGAGDLFHPTPKGGEIIAEMFYNAMMQGFAAYLEKEGVAAAAAAVPADPLEKITIR